MKNDRGGLPRGAAVEVYGHPSSGKTTLAMSATKEGQALGLPVIWLDYERAFHRGYAENMEIDLDPRKFVHINQKLLNRAFH